MDLCVVVDNSPEKNAVSKYFESNSSYIYINMHGNQGIAAAINAGIAYLDTNHMDLGLTMDQDSVCPTDKYSEIIRLIEKYMDTYSLIGLNVNEVDASNEIVEVPYVDFELGYRFKKENLKIGYLSGYCISHTIGNPIEIRFLGKTFHALNHSPMRYYYRYRNAYYLYHYVDREFFKKEYHREMVSSLIKLFIFERQRKEKLKMIRKGIKDAKNKRLGKL